jgi:hypothetical protein
MGKNYITIIKELMNDNISSEIKYIGTKEAERLMTPRLPASGQSSFKETLPTIFTTPKGVSTTNKGEAADIAAVETGKAKQPRSLNDIY